MRNLLFFVFLFLVCACGDSEFTKFNNRIIMMETLSKSEGLSSNVLSSYLDSIAIIKAQISLSKVEEKYKDSLNSKLDIVYDDLRISRAYNCIKDKTIRRTNSINSRGDKVRTKIEFISKDSVSISHVIETSRATAWATLISGLSNQKSNLNIPKNNTHRNKIQWVPSDKDGSIIWFFTTLYEQAEHEYDPKIIEVNDVECTFKITL
jgi:hypothetical protein